MPQEVKRLSFLFIKNHISRKMYQIILLIWLFFPLSQSCYLTFSKRRGYDEISKQECTCIIHLKVQSDNIQWAAHHSGRASAKCTLKENFGESYILNSIYWGKLDTKTVYARKSHDCSRRFCGPYLQPLTERHLSRENKARAQIYSIKSGNYHVTKTLSQENCTVLSQRIFRRTKNAVKDNAHITTICPVTIQSYKSH